MCVFGAANRWSNMPKPPDVDRKPPRAELERQLDDALEHTFPASDPVTIGEPTAHVPDRPADRQTPLIDVELVNELASHLKQAGKGKQPSAKAKRPGSRG
jgi:hypothetical protein